MLKLNEIHGQPLAVRMLKRYLEGPLPPLMILYGPEGTGKWTAAEAFVAQKLCSVGTSCGACPSCRKLLRDEHPDFIRFPEEATAIGSPESPEPFTVRWLLQTRICYTPFAGDLRFVLFPRADLIQHEAETALLKTLEEPPDHTRFIFIVRDLSELKSTVVSRGVAIPFQRLSVETMHTITGIEETEILELSAGSIHYIPFLISEVRAKMREKISQGLNHPLALLELERWLHQAEKKVLVDEEEVTLSVEEFVDFFGLTLLRECEKRPEFRAIADAIFEFKEDLHRELSGLVPYLTGRLFHRLSGILFRKEIES
jgi:DNA polymerase-3 subunit gamma/tau